MAVVDREAHGGGASFLKATTAIFVLAVVAVVVWAVSSNNPSGGEPIAVIPIPDAPDERAGSQDLSIRATVDPGDARFPADSAADSRPDARVRIIDPAQDAANQDSRPVAPLRLARAPIDALVEQTEFGPLPRVGPNGQTPGKAYARPESGLITGPGAPVRIAIVVGGLGISASGTAEAIQRLPAETTLAFAPYGSGLQAWVDRARSNGHEVLLQIPMEPFDFPDNDPGPHTLLTSLQVDENMNRLRWLMGRFTGYFGITNYMGAKFTASPEALGPIIAEAASRGLALVDDGSSPRSRSVEVATGAGVGVYRADVTISPGESRERIEEALRQLESIAQERGSAVGAATALPLVVETLTDWSVDLGQRGGQLVPVSTLLAGGAT